MADNFYCTSADRNEWVCSKCWALINGPWRDNHLRWHVDMSAVDASPNGIPASTPQLLLSVATGHATSAVLPSTAPKVVHDLLAAIEALRKRAWGAKDLKIGDVFTFHGTEFLVSGKDGDSGRPLYRPTSPTAAAELNVRHAAVGYKLTAEQPVNCPCLNPQCPHESHKQPVTLQPNEVENLITALSAYADLLVKQSTVFSYDRSINIINKASELKYRMRKRP